MVEQPTRLAPGHRYLPKEDAAKLASEWAAEERRNNPSPPPPPRPKPPTPLTPAEKAARRRRERERAAAEKELGRQRLIQQIEFKEQRRKAQVLYKEAQEAKRQHEAWDPTPVARAMYDDQELRARAAIPGPGSYTPKSEPGIRLTVGRTIGGVGVDFESKTRSPGPAAYLPVHVPPPSGSTFGLPPKLRKGRFKGGEVPSAHDIGYMVDHLRDLPAPGHYHPRNHLARNRGFYMHRPKQASATSPSSTTPGPGTYNTAGNMIGKAPKFSGAGGKTSLDQAIHQAKQLPGPGAHMVHESTLRTRGVSRFTGGGGMSMIESIVAVEKDKPGPGTYHATPTFAEEKMKLKYKKAVIAGGGGVMMRMMRTKPL